MLHSFPFGMLSAPAYAITYSADIDGSGGDSYFSRIPGSAGNRQRWSYSMWFKLDTLGTVRNILATDAGASTVYLRWQTDNKLELVFDNTSKTTNAVSDTTSWHHLLVSFDSLAVTTLRVWIDGSEETLTGTLPGASFSGAINNTTAHRIGAWISGGERFDGHMADVILLDGQSVQNGDVTIADFYDAGSPVDPNGLTFSGTNTFWFDMKNGSSLGDDNSGNGNNWVENGTITQSTDVP